MAAILTEQEISVLRADRKEVTSQQLSILLHPKATKRHRDCIAKVHVKSDGHRTFQILARLSPVDDTNFSVLVFYRGPGKARYTLVRCNGNYHGEHPNRLEIREKTGIQRVPARTCHIHYLTERYQHFGKPQGYAEPSNQFCCFKGAVEFVCDSFGFCIPTDGLPSKYPLFPSIK